MRHANTTLCQTPQQMVPNPIFKAVLMLGCLSMPWMAVAQNSAGNNVEGITNKVLPMTHADSTATSGRALPATQTVCAAGTVQSGGVCIALPNTSVATCGTSPETSRVTPCQSGYTGTVSENRTALCDNSTNYRWHMGPWTTTSSTCTAIPTQTTATLCGTSPETQQVTPCPTGFTGTVSENRTSLCTAATNYRWQMGPWTVTSSTCAAVPSGPGGVSCTSTPLSWTVGTNTCSATAPQTYSGSGVTLSDNTSPTTGNATFTCNGGSWSAPASASCTNTSTPPPTVTCPAITATNASAAANNLNWPSGCFATSDIPTTAAGYSISATAASPCSGTANYLCSTSGTWTYISGSITPAPTPTCPTTNIPVTSQTISCPAGQTGAITQTRTTSCNASTGWVWATGSWNTLVNTCTTPPPAPQACVGQSASWGVSSVCRSTLTTTASGQTVTIQNTANGYNGSASYTCNNGAWSIISSTAQCRPATPPVPTGCPEVISYGQNSAGRPGIYTMPAGIEGEKIGVCDYPDEWRWSQASMYLCTQGAWKMTYTGQVQTNNSNAFSSLPTPIITPNELVSKSWFCNFTPDQLFTIDPNWIDPNY